MTAQNFLEYHRRPAGNRKYRPISKTCRRTYQCRNTIVQHISLEEDQQYVLFR